MRYISDVTALKVRIQCLWTRRHRSLLPQFVAINLSSYFRLSHVIILSGVVISVCKPVYHDHKLQGVAAIDLRLADLLSSVTYYYSGEYSYAFIIDHCGRTLLHPLLPNPSTSERTARAIVDISTLEPKASRVISSMKRSIYQLSHYV